MSRWHSELLQRALLQIVQALGGGHREKRNAAVLGLLVRIHNTCTTAPHYDLRAGGCVSRAGKQRVEPYVELYHSYLEQLLRQAFLSSYGSRRTVW